MLFVATASAPSYLVDLERGAVVREYAIASAQQWATAYCSATDTIAVHQERQCMLSVATRTPQIVQRSFTSETVRCCAVSSCGTVMVAGTVQGNLLVWNVRTGQLLRSCKSHVRAVTCAAVNDNASLVVTASEDATCRVWRMATLAHACRSASVTGGPADLAVHGSGSDATGVFTGHTLAVTCCTFCHAHTSRVVTGSADMTCRVFDAQTCAQLCVFAVGEVVTCVAMSTTDEWLVAGTRGGALCFVALTRTCHNVGAASKRRTKRGKVAAAPLRQTLRRCGDTGAGDTRSPVVFLGFCDTVPTRVLAVTRAGAVLWYDAATGQLHGECVRLPSCTVQSCCCCWCGVGGDSSSAAAANSGAAPMRRSTPRTTPMVCAALSKNVIDAAVGDYSMDASIVVWTAGECRRQKLDGGEVRQASGQGDGGAARADAVTTDATATSKSSDAPAMSSELAQLTDANRELAALRHRIDAKIAALRTACARLDPPARDAATRKRRCLSVSAVAARRVRMRSGDVVADGAGACVDVRGSTHARDGCDVDDDSDGAYRRGRLAMLPALIKMRGLLNHHIASFNHLVDTELRKILLNESNVEIKSSMDADFAIRYVDIRVEHPREALGHGQLPKQVTPHECRLRDMTYRGDMLVDVEYTSRDKAHTVCVERNVKIGTIPIMLRSRWCNLHGQTREQLVAMRECPMDPGGYFIIKGVERVCLVQEQQSKNRVIIEANEHGDIVAHVQSKTHYSISKCTVVLKKGRIAMTHRSFVEDIPIVVVLKALGMESDQLIAQCIGTSRECEQVLFACFQEAIALQVVTQSDALHFIGARRRESAWEGDDMLPPPPPPPPVAAVAAATSSLQQSSPSSQRDVHRSRADRAAEFLASVLLCHIREGAIASDWNFRHKALYVCYMVRRMIDASVDATLLDERDFYGNKRFETTGTLMGLLFEDLLKQYNRVVRTAMDQQLSKKDSTRPFSVKQLMESKMDVIQNGMRVAISSGRWELKRFNMNRQGITQVLSRLSYIASLGMMTRIASSFEKTRKVSGPRSLQPSQWGMVCPCDTPEGESCGLVKNFAVLSQVTLDLDDTFVRAAAHNLGVEEVDVVTPGECLTYYSVFLNGTLIGIHRYPNRLCRGMRALRRAGRLHPHVSIAMQERHRSVQIGCDGGRIVRLLIIVKDGQPAVTSAHLTRLTRRLCTLNDFLAEGLVEYVDVNEANDCLIAVHTRDIQTCTTHLEVEPLSLLGVVAGIIPYPHHNQSARNTFQSAMGKQALGTIALNQYIRADTVLLLGAYPQRPLCRTRAMDLTSYEQLGAGINAMVCVMSYSGYDIEDAQVYNRLSLDRGYGRCVVLRKHEVDLGKVAGGEFELVLPPEKVGAGKYKAVNADGVASKGAWVSQYDVLVNKHTPVPGGEMRPTQLVYKFPQPAVVDHVSICAPGDNDRLLDVEQRIKVVTREVRPPELGDKFSSRHGQKGVVGLISSGVDMPFNEQGMSPDMIMNPHGFPSRMTVGKLLELVCAKTAAITGRFGDGTAFAGDAAAALGDALLSRGYNYQGKDVFYSGITGDIMQAYVFFGPIYYQRLKHMVTDKMHARATGPRSMLTRQPTEGRSRSGGLRVGEMERDCMVGYGATRLLYERLLLSSDLFTADVCQHCGYLGYNGTCQYCKSGRAVVKVNMPYAFKLLAQEMQGMGISMRLTLDTTTSTTT